MSNPNISTSARRREVINTINTFYAQPVARVSFELITTVVVILFFAVFAIRPTLLTMSDLIKEIDDKRKLDTALTQKVAALSTGQSEYLTLSPRLPILDTALPAEANLTLALKIIEKIASEKRLAITSLIVPKFSDEQLQTESGSPQANVSRKNLNISLSVAGDYVTIREYIADLQNLQRVVIVESVSFTVGEADLGRNLQSTINLNLPYYSLTGEGL